MYLRGVPSHVSRGPEFGPLHSIVLPVEGWRPVKLLSGVFALMVYIVPASPCFVCQLHTSNGDERSFRLYCYAAGNSAE